MNDQAPSTGEKGKARDILAAIRTLKTIEAEHRPPTDDEMQALRRFGGFGPVALSMFPNPTSGTYKDAGWQAIGDELKSLLKPDEYDSARRTVFSQFFTSYAVIANIHAALAKLGVPVGATVLEPGCGTGNFMRFCGDDYSYIGVELDSISGRIARVLHPKADIRIENFRDTKLPALDAVIGNVPFADVKIDLNGQKFSLHDYFIAKSVDALKPGGVLAVVTSHYTLDKQNAAAREYLASKADFLGAIRLPSNAFKAEGTQVTTDIVFLRKRAPGQEPNHADPEWLETSVLGIAGADLPVNRYFCNHHEMVLGDWSRTDTLYGSGFSVLANGDLASQLKEAIARLPDGCAQKPKKIPETDGDSQLEGAPKRPDIGFTISPPAFTPPPPERHVTEGSFFVGDDKVIRQVENGQGEPVTYGGKLLTSDGAMTARRIASLIGLRDAGRRVLQSQNQGWPEENRQEARQTLNRAYDRFVSQYGPINKTTFSEGKDGTQTRRMPNLVKFKEDPDAMLVMSLEEYDEATGKAEKAAIMKRDVVGPKPPITHVASAEEGLLVSLDHRGAVDLPFIAGLYGKPEAEVIAELADLIYRDPASKDWETADAYLSGDVRAKLVAAEQAGSEYARNAVALRSVQPEDVLPGDIDANLGAPWIPASDIKAFAEHVFGGKFTVGHMKKDAIWSAEADYAALQSVASASDYGTGRIKGTDLFDQALNLKTPVIYDTVAGANGDQKVINPVETQAAREKQKLIKEKFKGWIFADPDRTERLVRIYNDTYNNLRPRLFDGAHLDFPGMSKAIELRPHQKDGIWRGMSGGNTLLAHVVGSGKTWTMEATGMKMRQTGLAKKPMFVVPNHMLDQFSREFLQLYPNAKLLAAGKDDIKRENRKMLTAKIATGDWDAIIVTHSGFEKIGMSKDYQEEFLREQIAEYDALLVDSKRDSGNNRNIIKQIEKQKARREEKLKDLLAADKKDDGLVFDELGVDQLFIDESHYAKNLETPTKMDRVAGIQTGGSERAFDLFMKCRYLGEKHPGHGVVFASGTPISNSMVELYTVQRFLDPEGLRSRGIEHFDAWAASFGEVVDAMEISPDGASMRPRSRFAKFVNLSELMQMFHAFADVQTAEMLDLPRPKLASGKPQTVACPMSDEQARLQAALVGRYERIRREKVDPREDNALAITTDGRKLALDGRMLGGSPDFLESKINALAGNVTRIWRETTEASGAQEIGAGRTESDRGAVKGTVGRGTQMIFCDMGVNPTPWGFSAYDEVVAKLTERGIPRQQIAIMGDADTDAKKQALFEKVRAGTVRVLIGSTAKMGTGTNVQKRLVALHHLDAPWKPAEVEQREGRILRQGNMNEEVAIYRYVTEGSFDAYMWQALETKARFISQVMTGESGLRRAEDIGEQELSYAEVKAIASGNPAVLTLAEADAELQRLSILRKNHRDEQYLARRMLRDLPDDIRWKDRRIDNLTADMATVEANPANPPSMESLEKRLDRLPAEVEEKRRVPLGTYRGLEFGLVLHPFGSSDAYVEGKATLRADMARSFGPRAMMNAVVRLVDAYAGERAEIERDRAVKQGQLRDYESRIGRPFEHEEYISQLSDLRDQLKLALSETPPEGGTPITELAEQIHLLRAANTIEAAPQRAGSRKAARAERPVTARIRERMVERPTLQEALAPTVAETISQPAEPPVAEIIELPKPPKPTDDNQGAASAPASFGARIRQGGGRQLSLF